MAPISQPAEHGSSAWGRLSIQSQLLVMLLATSMLTALVVGLVAYRSGTDALENSVFSQLTNVREGRAREITNYFQTLQAAQLVYSRSTTTIDAVTEFSDAYHVLGEETVTAAEQDAIDEWYEEFFAPALSENAGVEVDPASMLRMGPAERYLKANYTAAQMDYDEAIRVDNAGDGSDWSAANELYHDYFREMVQRFSYEDVLLIDTDGDIIYSAYKGFDLGDNVGAGIMRGTVLHQAFDDAIASDSLDFVAVTDFERHPPPFGEPQMWTVSLVGDRGGEVIGALALKLPIDVVNGIMTHDGGWADEGLGRTGETYLVGGSGVEPRMRSVSRFMLEDRDQYAQTVIAAGTPVETAETMVRIGRTILLQPVDTVSAKGALSGQTDIATAADYRGVRVLTAYAPLSIGALEWGIVAEIDEEEALAPVRSFARNLALSTAAIVLVLAMAAMALAKAFADPIKKLVAGVRRIAAGETGVTVEAKHGDEFGDLAAAFNDMSASLTAKNELIDDQQAEYTTMLLTMMPEPMAERFRTGEGSIAEEHPNVSVIFGDVAGFDEFAAPLTSEESVAKLTGLFAAFDEAAAQHGVERVRTLRHGYLASCGLVTPRIDHVRRAVDFAQDMQRAVETFNAQHEAGLLLRTGIDSGQVTSGLLGKTNVVYDLWGETVSLAFRVHETSGEPGIFVTDGVYERLRGGGYEFSEAGQVDTTGGSRTVWLLRPSAAESIR